MSLVVKVICCLFACFSFGYSLIHVGYLSVTLGGKIWCSLSSSAYPRPHVTEPSLFSGSHPEVYSANKQTQNFASRLLFTWSFKWTQFIHSHPILQVIYLFEI